MEGGHSMINLKFPNLDVLNHYITLFTDVGICHSLSFTNVTTAVTYYDVVPLKHYNTVTYKK